MVPVFSLLSDCLSAGELHANSPSVKAIKVGLAMAFIKLPVTAVRLKTSFGQQI
jgi:hypothetical protein